ncbi:MAG TPA: cupin domain-containing protein [Elusimicrobiota bacterium]|nr:cupin domain-containing protein [Elusimicrobiota bacterium]
MTDNASISALIRLYNLRPHPEGGYFRETYRAGKALPRAALGSAFGGARSCSTAVYFLLAQGEFSRLHRIKSDEVWHFYLGGPLSIAQISPEGAIETVILGRDAEAGQTLQHAVPAGWWFGAYPAPGSGYSLVGCTVSPGFDFADLELGRRADLLGLFPHAKAIIERLTD